MKHYHDEPMRRLPIGAEPDRINWRDIMLGAALGAVAGWAGIFFFAP